ncbi:MAG TPA: hypothetical protein VG965_00510 [Patescibacteria group bacterium]|nr:hypothetical protein [Patescibacteria group bacterium]
MRSLILNGSKKFVEEFLEQYIRDNNIPEYNILRFEEQIKISDARKIKQTLSIAPLSGRNRLVIISAEISLDAQSALLKTLEELDEVTDFVFVSQQELLPTIVSRCTVFIEPKASYLPTLDKDILLIVNKLLIDQPTSRLALVEELIDVKKVSLADIILCLRAQLLELVSKNDSAKIQICAHLIKELTKTSKLVTSNNLNSKTAIERLFLKP